MIPYRGLSFSGWNGGASWNDDGAWSGDGGRRRGDWDAP